VEEMVRVVAPALVLADAASLAVVALVVGHRARDVRRGMDPSMPSRASPWRRRSSRATHLAWAGGAAAAWWAWAVGGGPARWGVAAGAAFVLATGSLLRVTRLEVDDRALTVRYARRRARRLRWDDCRALRPPALPLLAWRIVGAAGTISLMPSDLLGNEPVLADVVRRAGLTFDRGTWVRREPAGVSRRPP
jgi:hypothetical protein